MPSEDQHIERDSSAPVQQADAEPQMVDVVGLLCDEFGLSRSAARMEIATGTVTLDGEKVTLPNQGFFLDREIAAGKTLEVQGGQNRTFRVQVDDA